MFVEPQSSIVDSIQSWLMANVFNDDSRQRLVFIVPNSDYKCMGALVFSLYNQSGEYESIIAMHSKVSAPELLAELSGSMENELFGFFIVCCCRSTFGQIIATASLS